MIQGYKIERCTPEYSENMLPIAANLNNDLAIIQSGDGIVSFSTTRRFDGEKAVEIYSETLNSGTKTTIFDFGNSLSTVIQNDGIHIFSAKLFSYSTGFGGVFTKSLPYKLRVKLFVNAVNVETFEFDHLASIDNVSIWETWAQSHSFLTGQTVDWRFELETQPTNFTPSPPLYLYLDALKFEIDNRNLGLPSVYSSPVASATALYYVFAAANYTLTSADETVEVTVSSVQTLPSAIGLLNKSFKVINATAGQVTVDTTASQTIGNKVSGNPISITLQPEEYLEVISNGINYRII